MKHTRVLEGRPILSLKDFYIFVHKSHFRADQDYQQYQDTTPTPAERLAPNDSEAFSVAQITRIHCHRSGVKATLTWKDGTQSNSVEMSEWLPKIEKIHRFPQIRSAKRLQGTEEDRKWLQELYDSPHAPSFTDFRSLPSFNWA